MLQPKIAVRAQHHDFRVGQRLNPLHIPVDLFALRRHGPGRLERRMLQPKIAVRAQHHDFRVGQGLKRLHIPVDLLALRRHGPGRLERRMLQPKIAVRAQHHDFCAGQRLKRLHASESICSRFGGTVPGGFHGQCSSQRLPSVPSTTISVTDSGWNAETCPSICSRFGGTGPGS